MHFIDRILFAYSTAFVMILTFSGLQNGFTKTNIITVLMLAPISIYLAWQILMKYYKTKYGKKEEAENDELSNELINNGIPLKPDMLDLRVMFSQTSASFLVTITLFTLALSGTLARTIMEAKFDGNWISPVAIKQYK